MDLQHEKIESFLGSCIARKLFRGAVYCIGEGDRIIAHGALGHSVVDPVAIQMKEDTIFDLSSLTKPLCTALLAVILAEHGIFRLNDPVSRFFHYFGESTKRRMKIIHLLTHSSGLPRWIPFYLHADDSESVVRYLASVDLRFQPGKHVLYGCPAYILMGEIIQKATGEGMDGLYRDLVSAPLALKDTGFNPPSVKRKRIAASEKGNRYEMKLASSQAKDYRGYRAEIIWGKVHDHNSFMLGGISGNAGLFSNAREILALSKEFLGIGKGMIDRAQRRLFLKDFTEGMQEHRSLGWQIASSRGSSAGSRISPHSIGHTGFTGVSLWIDPERSRIHILLTNRTHPVYKEFNMNVIRRRFHRLSSSI